MLSQKTTRVLDKLEKKPKAKGLVYDGAEIAAVDEWLRLHRKSKDMEGKLGGLRESILEMVRPWHTEAIKKTGRYEPTVMVAGAEGVVQVQLQRQFAAIAYDRKEELQELLGEDFESSFTEKVLLGVCDEVAGDPAKMNALVSELVAAFGERLADYFECERQLVPSKEFVEDLVLDEKLKKALAWTPKIVVAEKKAAA